MPEQPTTPCKEKEIVYLQPAMPYGEEDEINLLDLWRVIVDGKRLLIGITLVATLLAAVMAFFVLPVTYQSTAVLSPISKKGSGLSKYAGLLGSLPLPISLPDGGQTGIMAFLESRTLKERLISKYDLLPVLYNKLWDPDKKGWTVDEPEQVPSVAKAVQRDVLQSLYAVSQDKETGLITLSWQGEDPAFCAVMLQRVIAELDFFLKNEYISNASREREFVAGQLAKATRELEYWERQVPSDKLTLATISREQLAAQTVYTELRKQLELAKISEAKENVSFKVLDQPFVPVDKFKPKRKQIVVLAFVGSLFLGVLAVFLRNFIRQMKEVEG